MGKIDTTKIEGYDTMTPEQKLAALEAFETDAPDYAGYIKKDLFDKTASELADHKKQLKAKMTEDEQKEAERAAKEAERDALLASLQKDKSVSDTKAQFLGLGYEAALAEETAKAMVEGDMAKVFANQKKHLDEVEKKVRAEALKETPKPVPGGGGKTLTKEQFDAMGYSDRLNVFNEQPDLYKEFTGGTN